VYEVCSVDILLPFQTVKQFKGGSHFFSWRISLGGADIPSNSRRKRSGGGGMWIREREEATFPLPISKPLCQVKRYGWGNTITEAKKPP